MNKVVHTIYGKMFEGKIFVVFMDFHLIANLSPQIMALSISNISLQA